MPQQLIPTYTGYVGSNKDALLVIDGALNHKFPLVQRRPADRERRDLIKSGNVFVFVEESSEIKRWTDGISWSASRILGRFLIYREHDKSKDEKKKSKKADPRKSRDQYSDEAMKRYSPTETPLQPPIPGYVHRDSFAEPDYVKSEYGVVKSEYGINKSEFAKPPDFVKPDFIKSEYKMPFDYAQEDLSRQLKPQVHEPLHVSEDRGLIKKTISLTVYSSDGDEDNKQTVHLISYYSAHDVLSGKLVRPSEGDLQHEEINPQLWQAVKRSSLCGKCPVENEAHFYLDRNYQLQNMTLLLANQNPAPTLSSALAPDLPHMTDPRMAPQHPNHYSLMHPMYGRQYAGDEPSSKRSKSISNDHADFSSADPTRSSLASLKSPDMLPGFPSQASYFTPGSFTRDPRQPKPDAGYMPPTPSSYASYDHTYSAPGLYPQLSHQPSVMGFSGGYEQYSAPGINPLNNSAFGLQQASQSRLQYLASAPQQPFCNTGFQQRLDGSLPAVASGGPMRTGAQEDVDHFGHDEYN